MEYYLINNIDFYTYLALEFVLMTIDLVPILYSVEFHHIQLNTVIAYYY